MGTLRLSRCVARLRTDESAQDLIEYAFLAAAVAVAALLLFTVVAPRMGAAYTESNEAQDALWQPCDPGVACS